MSKKAKKGLVPELRFPSYGQDGEWKEGILADDSTIVRGGSPRPIDDFITDDVGGLNWLKIGDVDKNSKYVTGTEQRVLTSALDKTRVVAPGDLILSNSMSFGRPYIMKINSCIHDGWIAVTKIDNDVDTEFLYYLLGSDRTQAYFSRSAAGGGVKNLNADIIKLLPTLIPTTIGEQQTIAACLAALDSLLAAEREKLEALRGHKKGLMQQLFPAEGAKVPALRFPGFKGEWMEKTMSDLADITTGNKDTQNKVADGSYPFFVRSQTIERINSFSYDGEAILTAGDGVGVGKVFHYINGKFDFHQRVYCIYNFKKGVSGKFVFHFFSEHFDLRVMRMTAKNSVDSVRMPRIAEMPVAIPKDPSEQDTVANCLSSLDERMALQDERVALLEEHKKGLMQGLFPSIN